MRSLASVLSLPTRFVRLTKLTFVRVLSQICQSIAKTNYFLTSPARVKSSVLDFSNSAICGRNSSSRIFM